MYTLDVCIWYRIVCVSCAYRVLAPSPSMQDISHHFSKLTVAHFLPPPSFPSPLPPSPRCPTPLHLLPGRSLHLSNLEILFVRTHLLQASPQRHLCACVAERESVCAHTRASERKRENVRACMCETVCVCVSVRECTCVRACAWQGG